MQNICFATCFIFRGQLPASGSLPRTISRQILSQILFARLFLSVTSFRLSPTDNFSPDTLANPLRSLLFVRGKLPALSHGQNSLRKWAGLRKSSKLDSYTSYTISPVGSMMYIRRIPISVQARIGARLIVYTKQGTPPILNCLRQWAGLRKNLLRRFSHKISGLPYDSPQGEKIMRKDYPSMAINFLSSTFGFASCFGTLIFNTPSSNLALMSSCVMESPT